MLDPAQFDVNEAWIIFRLNEAPIVTEADGDFNVLCLMDAASCYILGNEFVPVHVAGLPEAAAMRLVEAGRSRAQTLPQQLLVPIELAPGALTGLAEHFGFEVSRVPEAQLSPFTSDAKEGFLAHVGGGKVQ